MDETGPSSAAQAAGGTLWDGYYINLDRAADRRERMEREFARNGLTGRYQRFPAVDGRALNRPAKCSPGETGIFRSHMTVVQKIAAGTRPGHVVEDDVLLSDMTAPAIDYAIRSKTLDHFDVLMLETYVGTNLNNINRFTNSYREVMQDGPVTSPDRLHTIHFKDYLYGLTSYVVSPRGARKLAGILAIDWQRGPTMPIDEFIQRVTGAGRLTIGCIFPFVTTIDLESAWESSAERNVALDRAMLQRLIRYSFFVRRDIAGYATPILERVLERLPESQRGDPVIDLYGKIIRYYITVPKKTAAR